MSLLTSTETSTHQSTEYAALVDSLHTNCFMDSFWGYIDQLAHYDNSCLYLMKRDGQPVRLANRHNNSDRSRWHQTLERKAYLLSPYYGIFQRHVPDGFYLIDEIAPDDFFSSEYFRTFYLPAGCKDEGVFLMHAAEYLLIMSLERLDDQTCFSDPEMNRLRMFAPLAAALLRKHWLPQISQLAMFPHSSVTLHDEIGRAFHQFGCHILTEREREVAGLILRGHSSKSAARILDISVETERVHRKRLYAKLGISSQTELFSVFLDASLHLRFESDQDPLEDYLRQKEMNH